MLVVTPADRKVHIFIDVAVESESVLNFVESPSTFKKGITASTPQNINRSSSRAAGTVSKLENPFVAGSGTTIGSFYIPAGEGPFASGAEGGNNFHEVFDSGTTYGIHVEFYESFA
jgi:hypothetical protein